MVRPKDPGLEDLITATLRTQDVQDSIRELRDDVKHFRIKISPEIYLTIHSDRDSVYSRHAELLMLDMFLAITETALEPKPGGIKFRIGGNSNNLLSFIIPLENYYG